jgi:hypothetical protein
MANTIMKSLDNMYAQCQAGKSGAIFFSDRKTSSNTTAATITSGYVTARRGRATITMPSSFPAGVTGVLFPDTHIASHTSTTTTYMCLEYILGTLTVSGNSFAAGVSMPSKLVVQSGNTVQTSTLIPVLVVTTALTATTPIVTITYANQDGTGSRTCTMTLPTNVTIDTVFCMLPHLQTGDFGVQSVSNISISTGSAGVLKVMGLLPLAMRHAQANVCISELNNFQSSVPMFMAEANEVIAFYHFGSGTAPELHATIPWIYND